MKVDVIIISDAKNDALKHLTAQTLNTLFASEENVTFYAYIIESSNADFSHVHKNVKTIHPTKEFGYHRYLNIGRKLGSSEYVCLCNNDLKFHKNWASNMINEMERNKLLSASPMSVDHNTAKFNLKQNSGVLFGYEIAKHVAGWCIFQKRSIYSIIGDLDERFIFWYCDNDYSMTLKKNNIKHGLVTSSRVDHIVSKTLNTKTKREFDLLTIKQENTFKSKWNI